MAKIIAALTAAVLPVVTAAALIFHFNYTAEQTTIIVAGVTALISAVGTILAVGLHLGDSKVEASAQLAQAVIGHVEALRYAAEPVNSQLVRGSGPGPEVAPRKRSGS